MSDLKKIVADNIASLRVSAGMTQSELGEKLNYSDKSVSKWERAAALPDAFVLKRLGEIFGVSVDYILSEHTHNEQLPTVQERGYNHKMITLIAFFGIWALALLVFVVFWINMSAFLWQIFVVALPVSILVVMILNVVWGKKLGNFLFISLFIWSIILAVYLCFLDRNWWQLFLLGVPAQIIVILSFNVRQRKKILK